MEKYTIYCTEEQTKKALELGAPLIKCDSRDKRMMYCDHLCYPRIADYPYVIPTAEQMVGWLEEQEGINNVVVAKPSKWIFIIYDEVCYHSTGDGYSSRKDATLAAIDAALEYLSNSLTSH